MIKKISTSFHVPDSLIGRRYTFVGKAGSIEISRVSNRKLGIRQRGKLTDRENSAAMDWMGMTVETIRQIGNTP